MSKINNTENLLEKLNDKCIDNIDHNFNLYLLNDLCEAGGVSELFNLEDWYLYYLECAWELNDFINQLLTDPISNKEQLLNAITLKRIIDERLMFFSNNNSDRINEDLGFNQIDFNSKIIAFTGKVINLNSFLNSLHKELINRKWIDISVEKFNSNFLVMDYQVPINWVTKQIYVVGLIKYLYNHQYLSSESEKPIQLISNHFKDHGKKFKITSLNVVYSQMFMLNSLKESFFDFIENCNKY